MMLSAENRRKCISIARRLVKPGCGSSRDLEDLESLISLGKLEYEQGDTSHNAR